MSHDRAPDRAMQEPLDPIAVLANPATSYWLRGAIVSAFERDPFDAERDALALAAILTRRVDELVERHFAMLR